MKKLFYFDEFRMKMFSSCEISYNLEMMMVIKHIHKNTEIKIHVDFTAL